MVSAPPPFLAPPPPVAWLRLAHCADMMLAVCSGAAHAATPLMIWPVDPVITEEQQAVAVWLENRGTASASLQVRVLDWSQTEGEEFFSSQKDVVASPPHQRSAARQAADGAPDCHPAPSHRPGRRLPGGD